jgi:hypothetical protein
VVHLVRDPRAHAASSRRHDGVPSGRAARAWVRTHRAIAARLARLPNTPRLLLRYEDLCGKPAATLARLHTFAGVDRMPPPSDFRALDLHILGNRMRLDGSDTGQVTPPEPTPLAPEVWRWAGRHAATFGYTP